MILEKTLLRVRKDFKRENAKIRLNVENIKAYKKRERELKSGGKITWNNVLLG